MTFVLDMFVKTTSVLVLITTDLTSQIRFFLFFATFPGNLDMRSHSFLAIEWIQVSCENMFVLERQSTTTLITTFLEFSTSFFVETISKVFTETFLSSFLRHRLLVVNHVKHVVNVIRLEIFTLIARGFVCFIEWLRLTLCALLFHGINSYLLDSILNVLLVTLSVRIWIHWTLVF